MSLRRCSLVTAVGNGPLKPIVDIDVAPYVVVVLDWSVLRRICVLLNHNQLIGAQNRSVKTKVPLRRLQPTLNNRYPAGEIFMLRGEQP